MEKKLVSVCIPVWNSEDTITDTINSVLNQTYGNIEIIVVDNNSTDSTWEKINSFADLRIKKFRNDENIGMVGNWNRCLEYAAGEYVHFLCGDDIILPECIEYKVNMIEKHPEMTMVFSASTVIDPNGKTVLLRQYAKKDSVFDGLKLAKKSFLSKNLYGEPSNVLFRKSILSETGLFPMNIKYSIDWDMWLRLSCKGTVGFVKAPLMKYRISSTNGTSTFNMKTFSDDDREFIKNLRQYKCFKISFLDEQIHLFTQKQRMRLRLLFMKLKCR